MFSLLVIFALFSSTIASLTCLTCEQTLKPFFSGAINTKNCSWSGSSTEVCKAVLTIDYASENALITFAGDSDHHASLLNKTNLIKHRMEIMLDTNQINRTLQLFCAKNDSCSAEMKEIYDRSKKLNHTILQDLLKTQLYQASSSTDNLTCANNGNQVIPCPKGCCELRSISEFNLHHRCDDKPCGVNPHIVIESQVIGQAAVGSSFVYRCNKPLCNDKKNAQKVRDILESNGLLTPTGTTPDPSNAAESLLTQTLTIIQCLLMITMIFFSKLY